MAVKPFTETVLDWAKLVTWTLAAGDTGEPYANPEFYDRSVQVIVAGTAGTTTIQGANFLYQEIATATYGTLTTTDETVALTFTATGGPKVVLQPVLLIRPSHAAGDGTTVIVVRLFLATSARR